MSLCIYSGNRAHDERPVSVLSKQSETASLLPPPSPPKYIIAFARFAEVVLGSPGEQLLHLLQTGYPTGVKQMLPFVESELIVRVSASPESCIYVFAYSMSIPKLWGFDRTVTSKYGCKDMAYDPT